MAFLSEGSRRIVLDENFDDIVSVLKSTFGIHEVFFITTVLGYVDGRAVQKNTSKGPEFRPSYLNKEQRSILYSILYDIYGDEFIEGLNDREFQKNCIETLKDYANRGLEILYEEAFKVNVQDGVLLKSHKDYDFDLLKYFYEKLNEVPF